MVSRGGRSKGCSNCRKRHVKCDEKRPVCDRCKKKGLPCDGPKEVTWINQNIKFSPSPPEDNSLTKLPVPTTISFVAFEDDICLSYTRKNLLRGGAVEMACETVAFKNGPVGYTSDPGVDLLRKAILSLAVTFFGSQHRQTKIKNRGYEQYGEVLRQLNQHLTQPHLQTTNETIITVLTCMLLEIFMPSGPDNFIKHVRGIEALLELRGPPEVESKMAEALFYGLRVLSIIGALAQRKASIYAREDWKRIMGQRQDFSGVFRNQMFAILADCTVLMSKRTVLDEGGSPDQYISLLAETKGLLKRLEPLRDEWARTNEEQMAQCTLKLGKRYHIANSELATTYSLYNTTYMAIIAIIESLESSPHNISLRNTAAMRIVECLELKEDDRREGGPDTNTIGFVAIKLAWQALGGFSTPEGRKLARIVKTTTNNIYAVGGWEGAKPDASLTAGSISTHPVMWDDWTKPLLRTHLGPANASEGLADIAPYDVTDIGQKPQASMQVFDFGTLPFGSNYVTFHSPDTWRSSQPQ